MNLQTHSGLRLTPPAQLSAIQQLQDAVRAQKQVPIHTQHVFHAGLYARTITIPAGVVLVGALMKIPTMLIVEGDAEVSGLGRITGYAVLPGSAGRKQAFIAHQATRVTMVFKTDAKSVEDAEKEFTDEYDLLMSHDGSNEVIMTGE